MTYQYGQGFKQDLNSLVNLIKKENSIDFDPVFLEDEIKKILKYNSDSLGPNDSTKETQTPKEINEILEKFDTEIDQLYQKSAKFQKDLENGQANEDDQWNDQYESQITGLIDAKEIIRNILGPKINEVLEKIDGKNSQVSDIAEDEKINFTDKQSHYIQNLIDLVMDMIRENKGDYLEALEIIRDLLPCSCDKVDES